MGAQSLVTEDELLDLGRTFVNAEGADFAVKLLDGHPGFHPESTEKLDGGVNHLLCGFGFVEFGHLRLRG